MQKFYENLLGLIKENNLSAVDIDEFYFNYKTGNLEIDITDGRINKIELVGNKKTSNNVILREVTIKKNKIVRKEDVETSLKNIFSTNIFQQVSLDFINNSSSTRPDLMIHIVERSSRNIRFAFRVDNERRLQLLFDIRDENVFGTGNEIGLDLHGSLRNREYKLEIKSNRFFNTFFTYNLSLYYKFRDIYEYVQEFNIKGNKYYRYQVGEYRDTKYGGSFLLGTQLERIGTIYSQLIVENFRFEQLEGKVRNEVDLNVIKLKFGGRIDSQDKMPFPTKGSLMNFFYETAQDKLGGTLSYSKLFIDFTHHISLSTYHNISPRFVFGFADKTTPLQEQFSLGGQNSFFGMVEDELRGRQILRASLEYRYFLPFRVFFDTYFSVRYDLGRIWENTEDIRFKDLRHGLGITAAFDTPLGEASFSVGKTLIINRGLKKDSFILGPYTYYFTIGYDL
jgi:outer membrane protein assembly factor BamA